MTGRGALSVEQQRGWAAYRALRVQLDARLAQDVEAGSALSMADFDVLAAVRAYLDPSAAGTWLVPLVSAPRDGARTAHCVRVAALADRMGWSRSRLSRQLGRMEKRGLIDRVPCELDGRGDDVELTDAGRRALDGAEPGIVAAVSGLFAEALTGPQVAALTEICDALTAHLAAEPPPPGRR